MFKEYLLILVLGHIVGDFYTQTSKIAKKKKKNSLWVGIHSLIYLITMFIVFIPIMSVKIFILVIIASGFHSFIDYIKFFILRNRKVKDRIVFFTDQGLHILSLMILAYLWTTKGFYIYEISILKDFFNTIGISELLLGKLFIELLIIIKPTKILIQNMIKEYKPVIQNADTSEDNKAGRMIGTVERFVMFILLYLGQYSAIGFVLTAKSIARYDRISKDKQFAEYYLLGTLLSTGVVILSSVVIL